MLTQLLLILFLGSAVLVVFDEDLFRSLIYLSLLSIFIVILTYLYRAPAVTVTVAVVNGAISPMLFLVIMSKIGVLKGGADDVEET